MLTLQASEDAPALFVEFGGEDAQSAARSAAHDADRVVLTRTALLSLWQLDLKDPAASAFRLLAPHALRTQVREELTDAEERCSRREENAGKGESGLSAHEIPAEHQL